MRIAKFVLLMTLLASALVTAQSQVPSQPLQVHASVTAGSQTAVGNTIQMKDVVFVWAGMTLSADEAVMNRDTREIELTGHVRVKPDQSAAH